MTDRLFVHLFRVIVFFFCWLALGKDEVMTFHRDIRFFVSEKK